MADGYLLLFIGLKVRSYLSSFNWHTQDSLGQG